MAVRVETRHVVARKEHRCRECGVMILVGEEHVDDVLKEDDVYHWRAHKDCLEAAWEFDHKHGDVFQPDGRPGLIEDETFIEMVKFEDPALDDWKKKYPAVVARVQQTMEGWKK
ncbi:MAG TPA: hypothetical protein VIG24_12885 [Acidimicrobiia bacterium]